MGLLILGILVVGIFIFAIKIDEPFLTTFLLVICALAFPCLIVFGVAGTIGYEEAKVESITYLEPMGKDDSYAFLDGGEITYCISEDGKLVIKEEASASYVIREVSEDEDAKIVTVVEEGIGNFWVMGKSKRRVRFLDIPKGKLKMAYMPDNIF